MATATRPHSAQVPIADRIRVIDVDTHITEPRDLWTSRVAKKWGDLIPHTRVVEHSNGRTDEMWIIAGKPELTVGLTAMAGWHEPYPDHPHSFEEIPDRACWDAEARIQRMDEYGLYAQVIYPNVGGFGAGGFLKLQEPELMLECLRAYNNFLTDWSSIAPGRLIPVSALPFWDVEAAVAEIHRCAGLGHKGLVFPGQVTTFNLPHLSDHHWDPIWNTAQDLGLSINFHIGGGNRDFIPPPPPGWGRNAYSAKRTTMLFINNSECIADIIVGGVCHRFPRLNFVSVESGVGWVPFLLDALDWQWRNCGVARGTGYDLLPAEYFRRQIYGCFWFEEAGAQNAFDRLGPDNFLYETDFPHPTSMSPGGFSVAEVPRNFIERSMASLPEDTLRKVLHENAARLYHLD